MIDLTQIFSQLGIVSGNTNSNNQFEFYGNIEFDDGTITTNQYEFFKKIGMSRYEFFKQYGGEKEFYQNIQELGGSEINPNIYDYKTFYQNAGEYFGSGVAGPKASFTVSRDLTKLDSVAIIFTNTSTNADTYVWDFGDGSTSTATSPTHTYASAGSYTVVLSATGGGTTDTTSKIINVYDYSIDFTDAQVSGLTWEFTSDITTNNIGIQSYAWDFGDGSTASTANPTHTYASEGDYTVELTITFDYEVTDSTSKTVTVSDVISMTDLVAYYKLNGNGDDFYSNYDLTISNPAIIDDIEGKFDGGAYFPIDNTNGATGNSTMSINGNLDNLRMPFTVSMWVKPTATLTFLFTINGEPAEGGKGVSAYMAAAGQIVLEYHNGGPNGLPSRKTFATGSGLMVPDVWSHVVIYVEDINTNKVYVNGNEINIQYSSGEATEVVWGDNSSIGSRLNYLGHQVSKDAYFDDVSIWKRELTENEVIKLSGDSPLDSSLISMTDLTAYYKLNGNMDDYTTNYDGTASSASILDDIDGKFDGGAYFSPTNVDNGEYITLGNLGNLEEPFTVSGWYKSGGIGNVFLWSIGGDSTASPTIGGYGVSSYVTSSGALVIEYRNGGATNAGGRLTHTTSVGVVPMNEWVHIAIYVDGLGSHKAYINGILTSVPYESGAAAFIAWGNECTIGCRIVVGAYQASKDLYMDDVSIWNRELTENEVIKLSGDSPLGGPTP